MGVEFRNNEATFNEMAEDGDFTDSDLVITSGILLARCIRPKFIFWYMFHPTYDIDEDSSDEDIGESIENENVDGMDYAILHSLEEQHYDLDEFDSALNKMSITPKNSLHGTFGGAVNKPMRMPSRIRPSTSPESL
ncbi:unnamed protein product [Malus baccata var. baccata]